MKKNFRGLIYVFVLSVALSCFGQGQNPQKDDAKKEYPTLEFGQVIEREIGGVFTKHSFRLNLSAGQFIRIEAEQNGCDVIFALLNESGFNIFDVNNATAVGLEISSAAVEKSGNYQLNVMSITDKKGIYKLKFAEQRQATEKELYLTAGIILSNDAFNHSTSSATAESVLLGIAKFESAAEKFRLAEDKSFESRALTNIGSSYNRLGNIKKAIEYHEKALRISESIEDKYEISLILSNLALTYQATGDWQKAFDAIFKSLKIRRETGNRRGELISLNRIGNFFFLTGDSSRALEYFQQALSITRQNQLTKNYEADTYDNLGTVYLSQNEFPKAQESFSKSLEIAKETKSLRREADAVKNLGRVHFMLGDTPKAIEQLNEALKINRAMKDKINEAAALKILGQIYLSAGEIDKAEGLLNQSLEISRSVENKQVLAQTLLSVAKAEAQKGSFDSAQNRAEEAIDLVESVRARVNVADLRDSFSANLQDFYSFYVEILMRKHAAEPNKNYAALALQANERGKARGLLNLLAESNTNIREGVDEKLLEKETELKNLLSARLENLTKVLSGKTKPEDAAKLKTEIEQIRAEYEQIQTQIRTSSPHYSALTQPKTLDLSEIQKQVLETDSVLLEYALGEEKSYLWIVAKNDFRAVELPAKAEIERVARQFYDALTARNKQIKFETEIERGDRIFRSDSDLQKFSGELSQMILAPAAPYLSEKRLLIVADGALQYVPFASLQVPISKFKVQSPLTEDQRPKTKARFLIETNEIVNLPSASALAVLRNETRNRKLPAKTLAVLADPVFDKQDDRFLRIGGKEKPKPEFIAVSKRQTRDAKFSPTRDGLELPRLAFTRREADLISAMLPENQREKLLDFAANRASAMSAELSNFRFVHFATHGFINNENPELSGIVFSMIDQSGKERDGFLRVGDIYNLRLPAEMVVLSGCRTGLGKEIKGEGLVGLTRGFMYAGAKRVTVSLWDVNDEATSELMALFYREMLGDKKLHPAAALRQAQISMIKSRQWSNPYFWATFILQGEPR